VSHVLQTEHKVLEIIMNAIESCFVQHTLGDDRKRSEETVAIYPFTAYILHKKTHLKHVDCVVACKQLVEKGLIDVYDDSESIVQYRCKPYIIISSVPGGCGGVPRNVTTPAEFNRVAIHQAYYIQE
jgi:hypothetical protein